MVDRRPECPECGVKVPSTGHLVLFPCPKATVEVIEEWTPDVPLQSTATRHISTVTDLPPVVLKKLPKNRAWEQRNPERYRAWRREYMRRRRAQ